MKANIISKIDEAQRKKDAIPLCNIGDTVRVHVRIHEGDKERVQLFTGTLIARNGHGSTETVTVRRVSYGEGVERIFPIHSPNVASIEVERASRARRAKLYYMRGRSGKAARLEEKR